jgi:hypothetical protein
VKASADDARLDERRQRRRCGDRLLLQVLADSRGRREPSLVVAVGDGLDHRRVRVHAGSPLDEAGGDERGDHALGRQPLGELYHGVDVPLDGAGHDEDMRRHGCFFLLSCNNGEVEF